MKTNLTMKYRPLILIIALLLLGGALFAQNPYTIYPIPQEQIALKGSASFTPVVSVVAEDGIDSYTRDRVVQILQEHGLNADFVQKPQKGNSAIYLGINGSAGAADRKSTALKIKRDVFSQPKYDRHVVSLTSSQGKAQLVILGENTDAVFYGLATLEQMLDRGTEDLPCVAFYDYADVQNRGVIEGYYGVPYSMEVTEDLFRFMARYKLNTYMYGAKSDPYHSRYWDQTYPTKINDRERRFGLMTQDMMKQLAQVAHQCKVNFIWSIHPGQSFTDPVSTDVLDRIMSKFEHMYELGVRQFGVFVDDVGVPSDDNILRQGADRLTALQHLLEARWNTPGAAPADTVKPLQYVPQLYAYSWVKPEQAERFWSSLTPVPERVNIYTTGEKVWSVPNTRDVKLLEDYLGHEVAWWWNYPCNDVDVTKIFIADTYTNFSDEKHIDSQSRLESDLPLRTLIINPMQQGELSQIPLFSVADYSWNMETFDNMASWRASLPAVVGNERADALEALVPYLRYFDAQSPLAKLIGEFKEAYSHDPATAPIQPLQREFARIIGACDIIAQMEKSQKRCDSLFYADLRPFILKLRAMSECASTMLEALPTDAQRDMDRVTFAKCWSAIEGMDKNEDHQFDILRGMGSDITLSIQTAEPAAEALRPFLDWLLEQFEK